MAEITLGTIVAAIAGALLVGGIIVRVGKPVKKAFKAIEKFIEAWNGTPASVDGSGAIIKPAEPGVIATLEILRDQLQNSHQSADVPNLRDDLDTKASKTDVAAIVHAVDVLTQKVDDHIRIATKSDERQDCVESTVAEYLPKIRALLGEEHPPPAT